MQHSSLFLWTAVIARAKKEDILNYALPQKLLNIWILINLKCPRSFHFPWTQDLDTEYTFHTLCWRAPPRVGSMVSSQLYSWLPMNTLLKKVNVNLETVGKLLLFALGYIKTTEVTLGLSGLAEALGRPLASYSQMCSPFHWRDHR